MQGRNAAIILAAGSGERARGNGEELPKQYASIGGQPLIRRTVDCFVDHPSVATVVVVHGRDEEARMRKALEEKTDRLILVSGGDTRQQSTLEGLRRLKTENIDYVLIHDGARPFVSKALLDLIFSTLENAEGVIPVLAVAETLKQVGRDDMVAATVPRERLFAAQTPQAFAFDRILHAHENAAAAQKFDFTDDSAIAEWSQIPVATVPGTAENLKITWPEDIRRAKMKYAEANSKIPDIRTGIGYDVHSFNDHEGDGIWLCGVFLPHDRPLRGHSDADVAIHALTDALFGTCSGGDIGTHFPPNEPRWKDARSDIFIRHAVEMVRGRGGSITNADITIMAEKPMIAPHRAAMIAALSDLLGIEEERCSVKATTNEKIGFVGRQEGIAAIATVTVIFNAKESF